MNDTQLTVFLLGGLDVRHADQAVQLPRRKTRAVLAYLAAHPAPVMRDRLCELFWPDADQASARQALRATLHELRRAIDHHLASDTQRAGLTDDLWVDTRRLAAALNRPQPDARELAEVLAMYRGEFLAGLYLPDCEAFQAWLERQRDQYRALAIQGFDLLANLLLAQQRYDDGLDAIRRGLELDPFAEGLHRTAMRLHYAAGDRVAAIRRYEHLRTLLDTELGVPPMLETVALYDAVITDTLPATPRQPSLPTPMAAPPPDHVLPFVGREHELTLIGQFVATHTLILLEGESGIGKTRLAHEYVRASHRLLIKLIAREIDQNLPYQPLIEGLRNLLHTAQWVELGTRLELAPIWRAEVGRLVPELFAADDTPSVTVDEARLREGLSRFLAALAQVHPLVLLLDDAQWADAATLGLIGYLARLRLPNLLILLTAQQGQAQTPAAQLLLLLEREQRLRRIQLQRLTPQHTTALAVQISGVHAAPLAAWLVRHAEGMPLIIAELLQHARANGILLPDGTVRIEQEAGLIVPPTVYNLIALRLGRLSNDARRLLEVASVLGHEFDDALAARVARLNDDEAYMALMEMRRLGLVRSTERFAFDHSMTLEVVRREMGTPRYRQLHRRVAETLEQLPDADALVGEIAWHFLHAQVPRRALPYGLQAARRAEQLAAWAEAVGWYRRVLPHADPPQADEVRIALGMALLMGGQASEAGEIFRDLRKQAWERADYTAWGRATLALGRSLITRSAFADMMDLMREVCAYGPPDLIVEAEMFWGTALSVQGADLPGAEQHLQRAAELASERQSSVLAQITFERGSVAAQQGDLQRAVALYTAALALAEQGGDTTLAYVVLAHNNLGYHLLLLGDPHAEAHADAGLALAQERGMIEMLPFLYSTSGEIALAAAQIDRAEELFQQGLALAERLEMPERIAGLTANLGLIALQRTQLDVAYLRLSGALAEARRLGTYHLIAQILIWLAPLLALDEAHQALDEARTIAQRGGRRRLVEEVERVASRLRAP